MDELPDNLDRQKSAAAFVALLVLALLPSFLFMGDIPFINDEAMLLLMALQNNMNGQLSAHGLVGSFGVRYGPVIVWFYQAMLFVSKDPIAIAFIKSVICWGVILSSMAWVGGRLRLSYWPLLLLPLSPHAWFYQRLLWDNCFLLPVSAILVLLFVEFVIKPRIWVLALMALTGVLLFHIHLMSLMIIGPVGLASIFAARNWLRERLLVLTGILVGAALICMPYIMAAYRTRSAAQGDGVRRSVVEGFLSGVSGVRYFTHAGFDRMPEFYSNNQLLPAAVVKALVLGSYIAIALFLLGIVVIARDYYAKRQSNSALEVRHWVAFMSVLTMASMVAFFAAFGSPPLLQYYHAAWFVYFFFVWVGFHHVIKKHWGKALLGANVAALGILLAVMLTHASISGGNRTIQYGSTISNQMAVAQELLLYFPGVQLQVRSKTRPESIKVLMALHKIANDTPPYNGPAMVGIVDYVTPEDPADAQICVKIQPLQSRHPVAPR